MISVVVDWEKLAYYIYSVVDTIKSLIITIITSIFNIYYFLAVKTYQVEKKEKYPNYEATFFILLFSYGAIPMYLATENPILNWWQAIIIIPFLFQVLLALIYYFFVLLRKTLIVITEGYEHISAKYMILKNMAVRYKSRQFCIECGEVFYNGKYEGLENIYKIGDQDYCDDCFIEIKRHNKNKCRSATFTINCSSANTSTG